MKKFIRKIFRWKVPSSLPIKAFLSDSQKDAYTWDDWMKEMKGKYPIRYFLLEMMPDFFGDVFRRIDRFFYFIKSTTYKKQHLLDLRQPKGSQFDYRYGYSDIRQKFIYANFNLLCQFVEKEYDGVLDIKKRIDWLTRENLSHDEVGFLNKVLELYLWWSRDVQEQYKQLYNKADSDIDCYEYCKIEERLEEEIDAKLQEMLKLRQGFWT